MIVDLIMSQENENVLNSILIDGMPCRDSRLNSLMIGQPVQSWCCKNITHHVVWNGIIPELVIVLNTRKFILRLHGSERVYSELANMLDAEKASIKIEFYKNNNYDDKFSRLKGWVKSFIDIAENNYLHRRLNVIYKSLGMSSLNVNLNVLYDENKVSELISYMQFPNIHVRTLGTLEISMPAILSKNSKLSVQIDKISTLHNIPVQDIVILFVRCKLSQEQISALWPGVQTFVLSGDNSLEDSQNLNRLTAYYASFIELRLKKFLADFSPEDWRNIETFKALCSMNLDIS